MIKKRKKWSQGELKMLIDLRNNGKKYKELAKIFQVTPNAARKTIQRHHVSYSQYLYENSKSLINRIYTDANLKYISLDQLKEHFPYNSVNNIVNLIKNINIKRQKKMLPKVYIFNKIKHYHRC